MIISTNGPQNVGQIQKQFVCGNLFLSPEEYQRENAWNFPQKQLLIDTIFRGMDIPKFYLWKIDEATLYEGYAECPTKALYKAILDRKRKENDDPNPYIFEVVDGQQRIRTILEFMGINPPNDKCYRGTWHESYASLPETPISKGRFYKQLNADQQIMFDEKPLSIMILENTRIDEIRDMFLRLQNGTPLNAQQKRDAKGSGMGRVAKEIALMPFFQTAVNFDNQESAHHLVASQMLRLELKGGIASCTSGQLDKLYEQYKKASVDAITVTRAKKVVTILGKVFPTNNPHLNQNYSLSLYWLISRILLNYEIPVDQYPKIKDNFEKLDIARIEAMDRDYSGPNDDEYQDLSMAMSRGNTGMDGISTRHDIVGRVLFEGVSLRELPDLDPNRIYSYEEKLILYHRANGCCQLEHSGKVCGKAIPFDDAVIDHIVPHGKGGRTILTNGRVTFKLCNIARGMREDFDPNSECHFVIE
jgi:hypothetical protein